MVLCWNVTVFFFVAFSAHPNTRTAAQRGDVGIHTQRQRDAPEKHTQKHWGSQKLMRGRCLKSCFSQKNARKSAFLRLGRFVSRLSYCALVFLCFVECALPRIERSNGGTVGFCLFSKKCFQGYIGVFPLN